MKDRGGIRPKSFAKFHRFVDLVHHVKGSWVGQNRSMAEGSWAKFSGALDPADDSPLGDKIGGSLVDHGAFEILMLKA